MKEEKLKKHRSNFFYFKQFLLGIFDAFLVIFIIILGILFWLYYSATPAASQLINRKISQTSIIYDNTGEHILY